MGKRLVDSETGNAVTVIGPQTPSGKVLVQGRDGEVDVVDVARLEIVDD